MAGAVRIFTDGSSWNDQGGIAALLVYRGWLGIIAAPVNGPCTNQQAELRAAIAALSVLPDPGTTVTLYSDSEYMIDGFAKGWLASWRARGWRTAGGKPVANRELWETLEAIAAIHDVTWVHMRGHGRGSEPPLWVEYNARADRLATAARAEGFAVNRLIQRKTATPPPRSVVRTPTFGREVG